MRSAPLESRLLHASLLGTQAVYRVLGEKAGRVTVEVVDAPGLERGTRLRFTAAAVRALERAQAPGARPTTPRRRIGLRLGHA